MAYHAGLTDGSVVTRYAKVNEQWLVQVEVHVLHSDKYSTGSSPVLDVNHFYQAVWTLLEDIAQQKISEYIIHHRRRKAETAHRSKVQTPPTVVKGDEVKVAYHFKPGLSGCAVIKPAKEKLYQPYNIYKDKLVVYATPRTKPDNTVQVPQTEIASSYFGQTAEQDEKENKPIHSQLREIVLKTKKFSRKKFAQSESTFSSSENKETVPHVNYNNNKKVIPLCSGSSITCNSADQGAASNTEFVLSNDWPESGSVKCPLVKSSCSVVKESSIVKLSSSVSKESATHSASSSSIESGPVVQFHELASSCASENKTETETHKNRTELLKSEQICDTDEVTQLSTNVPVSTCDPASTATAQTTEALVSSVTSVSTTCSRSVALSVTTPLPVSSRQSSSFTASVTTTASHTRTPSLSTVESDSAAQSENIAASLVTVASASTVSSVGSTASVSTIDVLSTTKPSASCVSVSTTIQASTSVPASVTEESRLGSENDQCDHIEGDAMWISEHIDNIDSVFEDITPNSSETMVRRRAKGDSCSEKSDKDSCKTNGVKQDGLQNKETMSRKLKRLKISKCTDKQDTSLETTTKSRTSKRVSESSFQDDESEFKDKSVNGKHKKLKIVKDTKQKGSSVKSSSNENNQKVTKKLKIIKDKRDRSNKHVSLEARARHVERSKQFQDLSSQLAATMSDSCDDSNVPLPSNGHVPNAYHNNKDPREGIEKKSISPSDSPGKVQFCSNNRTSNCHSKILGQTPSPFRASMVGKRMSQKYSHGKICSKSKVRVRPYNMPAKRTSVCRSARLQKLAQVFDSDTGDDQVDDHKQTLADNSESPHFKSVNKGLSKNQCKVSSTNTAESMDVSNKTASKSRPTRVKGAAKSLSTAFSYTTVKNSKIRLKKPVLVGAQTGPCTDVSKSPEKEVDVQAGGLDPLGVDTLSEDELLDFSPRRKKNANRFRRLTKRHSILLDEESASLQNNNDVSAETVDLCQEDQTVEDADEPLTDEELLAQIHNISSVTELQQRHLEHLVKMKKDLLMGIIQGKIHCERHEQYKKGAKARRQLLYSMPPCPMSEKQHDMIMHALIKQIGDKYGEYLDYLMKVIFPELLIHIYMELHMTKYEETEEAMAREIYSMEIDS